MQDLSAEQERLFRNAKEMKAESVAHRNQYLVPLWDERNRFFMGDHWHGIQLEDYQMPVTINYCRKIYRWYLSLLTDQPARIAVFGRSADDYKKAEGGGLSRVERVNAGLKFEWDTLNIDNRIALLYSYALPYGVSWYKIHMNPAKKRVVSVNGQMVTIPADHDCSVFDPFYVTIDPNAAWSCDPIDAVDNAEYMFCWSMRSARYIKAAYPDQADKLSGMQPVGKDDLPPWHLRQGNPYGGRMRQDMYLPQANAAGSSTNVGGNWIVPGTDLVHSYSKDRFMVWECWMRDPDYPKGLVLTAVGDVLLDIRENPHDHGQFPFGLFVIEPVPGRAAGFGILDNIIGPQQALNRRHMQLYEYVTKANHRQMTYEEGSINEDNLVVGMPDLKLPRSPGSPKPEFMPEPQVPPEVWRSLDLYEKSIRDLSDLTEAITSGEIKAGTPNAAYESVIDQAMQAIRMAERWNLASKRRMGRLLLSDMAQIGRRYPLEVRITGEKPTTEMVTQDDWMGEYDFEIWPNSAMTLKLSEWFKRGMDINGMLMSSRGQPLPFPLKRLIQYAGFPDAEALDKEIEQNMNIAGQMRQMQEQIAEMQKQLAQAAPQPGSQTPQPEAGGQIR